MLTKKQRLFFDRVRQLAGRNRYFPTVREIGRATELSSPATVLAYLRRLGEKGYLVRKGRGWDLVSEKFSVPLAGVVPAGSPLEIFEMLGEEVELPSWMAERRDDLMAFRVQGESMRDAYIRDGDLVLIRRNPKAEPGEMVVARLADGSITLKRLKRGDAGFFLVPENPDFAPIFDRFQLVGKVVGVMRKYG
jgi:repressor LexA